MNPPDRCGPNSFPKHSSSTQILWRPQNTSQIPKYQTKTLRLHELFRNLRANSAFFPVTRVSNPTEFVQKNLFRRTFVIFQEPLNAPFFMGCFPGDFQEGKRPIKAFGETAH